MEQLYKVSSPCLDDQQFEQEELGSAGELSQVCPQIVLKCLYLTRIGRLDILWSVNKLARSVTKSTQACDRRLARLIPDMHHTKRFPTRLSCGKHGTALEIGFLQDSDFAEATLRIQNQLQEVSCVFLEAEHLSKSVGCARNKHQFLEVISLDAWLRMDGLLTLDLWDIVIEVLRTTKDNIQPNHTSSRNLGHIQPNWTVCDSKTKTQHVTRKQVVEQLSEVDHVPTNTRSSQGIYIVHLWRQRSRDQNDNKRTKSNNETRVQNPRTCSCFVFWQNQPGNQNPNQICWHQKPTCGHPYQRKFLERWVESPSVFVQYHLLAAIWKVLSLKPESALWMVPCRNEDRTQLRVVGLRWRKPDLPIWCCKVSAKRVSRHKDRGLQSIRWMKTTGKSWLDRRKLEQFQQVYRQEMSNLAARKLGLKDLYRPKREEGSSLHRETWCSITRNGKHDVLQLPCTLKRFFNAYRRNWEGLQ